MLNQTAEPTLSLLEALEAAAPQVRKTGERRLVIAQPTLKEFLQLNAPLPTQVSYTHSPLAGKRVPMRGRVRGDAKEPIAAIWPDDALISIRAPVLLYGVEGQSDLRLGDYILHLPAGHFCLLPPEVPRPDGSEPHVDAERRPHGRCDLLWMRASEGGLELWTCHSRDDRHWGGRIRRRVLLTQRQIWWYFSTLVREAQDNTEDSGLVAQNLLQIILVMVLRELRAPEFRQALVRGASAPERGPNWDAIEHARDYIMDNLQEHLTIDLVARAAYMSSSIFRQRFRQATGQTFTEYLTQCRRERAQVLLRETEWTVAAIAAVVGINPSHLRRLFIRYEGMSPQQYRRQAKRGRVTAPTRHPVESEKAQTSANSHK